MGYSSYTTSNQSRRTVAFEFNQSKTFIIYISLLIMDHFQQKEENYAKWESNIWNSVEKEISLFQKKVTDCMLAIGELSKRNPDDYLVEPCLHDDVVLGQDFYIDIIRPFCVSKNYLPKNLPTAEVERKQILPEEQEQLGEKKIEGKVKEKKTKTGKVKKGVSEEEMKTKIVKENFLRDLEAVGKSHSMERMQVGFGLKQKKVEVKLITFFYVAYFIRRNKVNLKMDDTQIFELVNIMIKIIRIFSGLNGPSFVDNSKKLEVSSSLILDLKCCVKQLKEFYRYTNRTLIIKYPKLVYYTKYDEFFPTLDIKPYPSQLSFIQAVKAVINQNGAVQRPTLIFYRTMIGSGKTSAAIALSQLIRECKLAHETNNSLQVLYTCLVASVRIQVGRYCYSKEQKFALAAMEKSIKDPQEFYPRIINSWSCRNEKNVDLIISDPYCAYEMLDKHLLTPEEEEIMKYEEQHRKKAVKRGVLNRQNILLFVDEPTAFCKDTDSKATRKLFDILANYPPKIIVLASATMPSQKELANTIELVKRRNPNLLVQEIVSQQFAIGCQYCSFKGEVIFPHTNLRTKEELALIIETLKLNAFLLKLYTGPSLFFLLRRCEEMGITKLPKIDELPEVRQDDITKTTFYVLNRLLQEDDKVIEQVCSLAKDENILDFKEDVKNESEDQLDFDFDKAGKKDEDDDDQAEEEVKDYVNLKKLLRSDAYKYLGGCLIGTKDPLAFAHEYFDRWVRKIKPIKRLYQKYQRDRNDLTKQIRLLEEDQEMREEKKTKAISKLQFEKEPRLEFPDHKKINTNDHYLRYCVAKEPIHKSMLIKPVPLQNVGEEMIEEVDDFVLKLLFCGVAIYAQTGLSAKYLEKVEQLASQNFLAYIITDESLCYGTNFPISNVILLDDLADKLNMNQMFQLIGRAGRVGQSWTARAFLQPNALKKLNNYIHTPKEHLNEEARIFQAIAKQYLNNPILKLRNIQSQVRYSVAPDAVNSAIEIIINKKDQPSQLIRNVGVAAVFLKDNNRQYLVEQLKSTTRRYDMPFTPILEEDLPMCLNQKGVNIINIALFSEDFKQFLFQTVDNALKRIFVNQIYDNVKEFDIISHFKPKIYEKFLNKSTDTLVILMRRKSPPSKQEGRFSFQELHSNALGDPDNIALLNLQKMLEEAAAITSIFQKNPMDILGPEAKKLYFLHQDMLNRQKLPFYRDIFEENFAAAQAKYSEATANLSKEDLKFVKSAKVALTLVECGDVLEGYNKFFHISRNLREVWNYVEKTVDSLTKL